MLSESRKSKRLKSRFSKLRAVLLLMVAFVVYFSMAKPAIASAPSETLAGVHATASAHVVHQAQGTLAVDESLPLSCEDCGDEDPDSSVDSDMDEFLATLPHLDLLFRVATYAIEDLRLSLPPYKRGLEYPPSALI
jgi:hypothetical protein